MNKDNNKFFEIPVVLFTFKRYDTVLQIIERLRLVKPSKIYVFSDGARNDLEQELVNKTRMIIESAIDWQCSVIKEYSIENQGVYTQIGLGAKKVLNIEKMAIFLEDDNLPAISFFEYCKELLTKYYNDNRVMWICGTNYLQEYENSSGSSYVFTQHLMPCGWASWEHKFNEFYDGELNYILKDEIVKNIKKEYTNVKLFKQQFNSAKMELERKKHGLKFSSWDFQMALSIRANHVYGISPKINLIENIGVDEFSEHGGNSFNKIMTKRFCGIPTGELSFPLVHPDVILSDEIYEMKVDKIILEPFVLRLKNKYGRKIKHILKILRLEWILSLLKRRTK